MKKINNPEKKRILIIDDNIQIHQDFMKVLLISKEKESDLGKLEEALLGKTSEQQDETYSIDCASQGEEGLKMVEKSIRKKEPYAVAFIDVRMPPGWDGIETISKIWEVYPELQVVICTAYSDYSWDELFNKFGNTDKLLILKKPFDNIEVRQLTYTLSKKWELNRIANLKMSELERNVEERTKELQLSEEKYRTMIEYSNDMIWTLDTKGNFLYFNKRSEELTGYDIKKGAGESFVPIILEEDLEMVQNVFLDTLAGNSNHYEVRIHDVTKAKILTLSVNTAPIIKEGKVVGTVSFGRDITESKQAEEALKQSEKSYRALFNNATDAIYIQDREYRFIDVNQGAVEMYGYPKEFFIGKTPGFLSAPGKNDMKKIIGFVEDAFNGKPRQYDFWGIRKNGEVFPKIVRSKKGLYLGQEVVITFALDITERKQAEKALKESEHNYRILFDNLSDGIFVLDAETLKVVLANKAIAKMYGFESELDTVNMNPIDFILPEYKEKAYKIIIDDMFKKDLHQINEFRSTTKDGREIWISAVGVKTEYKGRLAGLISVRDITERKRAEIELRRSEEQFRNFAENIPGVVCIYDWYPDGSRKVIYQSPGLTNITGKKLADKIKINHDEYFKLIPSEDLQALENASIKAIKTNKNLNFKYRLQLEDSSYKWILSRFSMFPRANGVIRWQGIIYDITQQKQAEDVQKTLYDISNALNTVGNLHELFVKIREYLGNVINTTNFYIALYDEKTNMISLPFDVDEKDDYETFPAGKTLTKYVIQTGKTLLATNDVVEDLTKKGVIETIGTPSEIWLGVPLKVENKVIGVIAVQSYDDPDLYSKKDIEILSFVSEEIALAVNRKQAEETINKELRKRQILQDVALSFLESDLKKSIKTSLKAIRMGLDLPKVMLRIRVDPNNDWQIVDYRENLLGIESVLPTNIRGVDAILAYEKKEISVVNDVRKKFWYEKYKDIWEKTKTLAYLSIPCMDYSGDVKGILYLHDDKVRIWDDDDKNIGRAVAAELASIIELKQAEEELKINRERLKVANSILRHDIANDVIVIKSALDIYRDKQDETMLDEIEKRVEKSLNTIKIQRDQETFIDSHADLDEYQIDKVVHDIIKNYPNIKFNVTGSGKAYADNAIYSVFENIISNAKKHSKTTKLDIDIHYNEDYCEIRFADYGIGIPDEFKYKIFGEGFQYGETGHTGIGLYIVKQTVEDYGGEVFVEDNKPNGAVFVIRLRKIIER